MHKFIFSFYMDQDTHNFFQPLNGRSGRRRVRIEILVVGPVEGHFSVHFDGNFCGNLRELILQVPWEDPLV